MLDVRTEAEWDGGHIEGAHHIHGGTLQERFAEVPKDRPVAVVCGSGYRASIASSFLKREGYPDVANVLGGMTAWKAAGTAHGPRLTTPPPLGTQKRRKTMSEHHATIEWGRETPDFSYETYNRDHDWAFDGGTTIRASAAPAYRGDPGRVDPEEAFVASLSSCHMLTFLAVACKRRFVVDSYRDQAVGTLEKGPGGTFAITRVILRPRVVFGGQRTPAPEELRKLHEQAHHACFIANSVTTEVVVAIPEAEAPGSARGDQPPL